MVSLKSVSWGLEFRCTPNISDDIFIQFQVFVLELDYNYILAPTGAPILKPDHGEMQVWILPADHYDYAWVDEINMSSVIDPANCLFSRTISSNIQPFCRKICS